MAILLPSKQIYRPTRTVPRLFDDASSQYLGIDQAPVVAYPFVFSCWFNITSDTGVNQAFISLTDNGSNSRWCSLQTANTGGQLRVSTRQDTATRNADTTNTYTDNVWQHGLVLYASSTDQRAVLNGDLANKGTYLSYPIVAVNHISIARRATSTPQNYVNGLVAECACWTLSAYPGATAAAKADNFEALALPFLAKGYSPLHWPLGLKAYWLPVDGRLAAPNVGDVANGDRDVMGNYHMSPTNSPGFDSTVAPPPIKYPKRLPKPVDRLNRTYFLPLAAAATTTTLVPISLPEKHYWQSRTARNSGEAKYPELWRGLVLCDPLNVPGVAIDHSTHRNSGTLSANLSSSDWMNTSGTAPYQNRGAAPYFTALDSEEISYGNDVSLRERNNLCASCWINTTDSQDAYSAVIGRWDTSADKRVWGMYVTNDDPHRIVLWATQNGTWSANGKKYEYNTSPLDGDWHNLVFRWTSSHGENDKMQLYLDGLLQVPDASPTNNNISSLFNTDTPLRVGAQEASGVPFRFFEGFIQNVLVWNRWVSGSEILQLYQDPLYHPLTRKGQTYFLPLAGAAPAVSAVHTKLVGGGIL